MRRHTAQVVDEDDFDSRASPVCYMDLSSYYSALEQVNTSTSNGPLTIAIVGAGIGGLAVAIGLRRNGHNVQVYDKSRLANDFGAAVHLCPNASGILRRWGIRAETFGANPMSRFVERAKDGQTRKDIDLVEANKRWAHPWHLVHRVALHEELKRIATSEESAGVPVRLLTSSNVVAVDPEKGATTLENGTTVTSDVVVGADGIYSLTRKYIKDVKLLSTGKAALGFMIPRSEAEADTTTAPLVSQRDSLTMWCGDDRRVVMYPCDNNQLLNFVCIHPENESHHAVLSDEWNKQASIDQVLKVYEDFDPRLKALISKADPSTIKVWQLPDMEKLPAWTSGKLVLLGDAAHPFTPHQAQGAAQAIEDAAALSTVLPQSTARDEIPARLKLYESIRYERAHRIQHYSRMAGQDWADGKPPVDAMEFQTYNFDHDEIAHASAARQPWESSRAPKSAGSGTGL